MELSEGVVRSSAADEAEVRELERLRAERAELEARVAEQDAAVDREVAELTAERRALAWDPGLGDPYERSNPDPYREARRARERARSEGLPGVKADGEYVRQIFEAAARGDHRVFVRD